MTQVTMTFRQSPEQLERWKIAINEVSAAVEQLDQAMQRAANRGLNFTLNVEVSVDFEKVELVESPE